MIKGCAKRVVVVKDIESKLFEEAFFIVRAGSSASGGEKDCLGEAREILKNHLPAVLSEPCEKGIKQPFPANKKANKKACTRDIMMFVSGFGVSAVICTLIYYAGMWI